MENPPPSCYNDQMDPLVQTAAARVKVLLMDVDGVLTDGRLYNIQMADGSMAETKGFDSQDGIGLQWLSWYGVKTGVISGRNSPATVERARQTKMTYVYQGHIEKIPILEEIMKDAGVAKDDVAYVGDDLTDIVCMRRVGFAVATANARKEVKAAAHYITEVPGGSGAIREVVEIILKAKGLWPEIQKKYEIL